jgi:membrane-bound lytic murein transglycosylase MltF
MKGPFSLLSTLLLAASLQANPQNEGSAVLDRLPITKGDLGEILQQRYIRVLVTHSQTNFSIVGGVPRGFEYELLKEYEKSLSKRVKGRFTMVFLPVSLDRLIPDLMEGKGDIAAAGLTITPERRKKVAFTDPYLANVKEIVVTRKSVTDVPMLDALAGRTVYVVRGSSYAQHLEDLDASFRRRGLSAIDVVEAPDYLEAEDLLELANAGIVALTVVDRHVAQLWSSVFPNLVLREDLEVSSGGQIAWAVRKENPKLLADLNEFVKSHRKGTLLGNIFFKRYFKNTQWIESPTEEERQRLSNLRHLFEKYSSQYGFDWLMMAALAYQESGLDQGVKSRAGAIGIMQIKPSTAADRNVNVADIHVLENNIHAGIKYLAWLRKHYFNESEIESAAKVDFTLAAYNAGPARIARLRRRAAEAGYDPNLWFDNVESVALKEIGWETVRYVANINKYYFAFRLGLETLEQRGELKKVSGSN